MHINARPLMEMKLGHHRRIDTMQAAISLLIFELSAPLLFLQIGCSSYNHSHLSSQLGRWLFSHHACRLRGDVMISDDCCVCRTSSACSKRSFFSYVEQSCNLIFNVTFLFEHCLGIGQPVSGIPSHVPAYS